MNQIESSPVHIASSPTQSFSNSMNDSPREVNVTDNGYKMFSSQLQASQMNSNEDDDCIDGNSSDQDIIMKEPDDFNKKDNSSVGTARVRQSSREVGERITLEILEKYYNMPLTWAAKELRVSNTMLKKLCRKYGIQRWPHRQIRSIENDLEKQRNIRDQATSQSEKAAADEMIRLLEEKKSIITRTASCGFSASLRSMIFMARPGELDAKQLILGGFIPAFQAQKGNQASVDALSDPKRNIYGAANPFVGQVGGLQMDSKPNPTNFNPGGYDHSSMRFMNDGRGNSMLPPSSASFGNFDSSAPQNRYANIQPNLSQHQPSVPFHSPFHMQSGWMPYPSNNDNFRQFGGQNMNASSPTPPKNDESTMLQIIQRQHALLQQFGYSQGGGMVRDGLSEQSIRPNIPPMHMNYQVPNHNSMGQLGPLSNRQKPGLLSHQE